MLASTVLEILSFAVVLAEVPIPRSKIRGNHYSVGRDIIGTG